MKQPPYNYKQNNNLIIWHNALPVTSYFLVSLTPNPQSLLMGHKSLLTAELRKAGAELRSVFILHSNALRFFAFFLSGSLRLNF
ncbi:MAG: hypothetical protein WCR72_04460, partial [Bacteroidota bacterium]